MFRVSKAHCVSSVRYTLYMQILNVMSRTMKATRGLLGTVVGALFVVSCSTLFGDGSSANVVTAPDPIDGLTYPVVDTGQKQFYNDGTTVGAITSPFAGETWYGQDAQFEGYAPAYTDNGNGTVNDNVTGLMWQQSSDRNGDGSIDADDKLSYDDATTYVERLVLGGYDDWRLPSVKELYSLIQFTGTDPAVESTDATGLIPFIDTDFFAFAYGDVSAGERIIDSQFVSSTTYVSTTMNGAETVFGVNFADGRIKGYGMEAPGGGEKAFFVLAVRGNDAYGVNDFVDNGDGTITDRATGLTWAQTDSGADAAVGTGGLNWEEALAWVTAKNGESYLGYTDWRLPNIKELQSIVDYSRSPDTTGSPALDPLFSATQIMNEAGETDYAFYWSGTTHLRSNGDSSSGGYVAFGRSLGNMGRGSSANWLDVHGAGSQRSDPKSGDPTEYADGFGPQGDAIRIYNQVRLVRGGEANVVAGGIAPTATMITIAPTTNAVRAGADRGRDGGRDGGGEHGVPEGQRPDLNAAARELGVTVDDLMRALGPPPHDESDLSRAARALGVPETALIEAFGAPSRR